MSMVLITIISNIVRGKTQPSLLYFLFLFLGGCLLGITVPFLFNLWFSAVLESLSVELQGVVGLVAGVLAPIAVGMNINELLNPVPSGTTTGTASGSGTGTGSTGPGNTGGNGPTNTGATGSTNTGSTGTANTGATVNTNNAPNPVRGGATTGPLDIADPNGKFSNPYNPYDNNTSILNSIADALERRYYLKVSSGLTGPNYIASGMFSPEQQRWISQCLFYHYPEFARDHRSKGDRHGSWVDFTSIRNTESFRNKFRSI